jgi:hypothetical protein
MPYIARSILQVDLALEIPTQWIWTSHQNHDDTPRPKWYTLTSRPIPNQSTLIPLHLLLDTHSHRPVCLSCQSIHYCLPDSHGLQRHRKNRPAISEARFKIPEKFLPVKRPKLTTNSFGFRRSSRFQEKLQSFCFNWSSTLLITSTPRVAKPKKRLISPLR